MNVALVVITNRGDKYLPRMLESLEQNVPYEWSDVVTVDDSVSKLGGAASVQRAWYMVEHLHPSPDYVFHVEEDWLFNEPVDIDGMISILEADPWLAQVVLRRDPARGEGPQGYIGNNPTAYTQRAGYLEHRQGFWLNPCLYPTRVTYTGWPDGGHEHHFTEVLLAEGYHFGVLGTHDDPPRVTHIGNERAASWTW